MAKVPYFLLVGLALLKIENLNAWKPCLAAVEDVELADAALGKHRACVIHKNELIKTQRM